MWHGLRRWIWHTAVGRAYSEWRLKWINWWYPPTEIKHGRGYGCGYGSVRKSRPVQALIRWRHRIQNSAVGKKYYEGKDWWVDWWNPISDRPYGYGHGYGYGYGNARRSRPVHEWRRFKRWFRKTWTGRRLIWALDDAEEFAGALMGQLASDLAWASVKKWMFRWQTAVWLPCLLAALVCGDKFGLPRWHQYQEQQYARQAQQMLAKGDINRAMLRARQVLSLNASNAVATRVIADVADGFGSPVALYWRQRALLLMPDMTNQIALASTALRVEEFPFPTATKTLNAVEPSFQKTVAYQRIAGMLALKLSKFDEAERHFTEAARLDPNDPVNRMSLAVVRLESKDPKIITDSRTTLELLRTDTRLGLLATRSLVAESIGRGDYKRAEQLSSQILTNAQATFSDRILHLAILNAEHSPRLTEYLASTEERARSDASLVGDLASWMNTAGFAQQSQTWLNSLPEQFIQQGLLPIALADSYAALGKWKEMENYLQRRHWPGMDHIRLAMLALAAAKESGNTANAVVWRSAIQLAAHSPYALNMLAKLASTWGWKDRSEEVLWFAADRFPDQAWPLASLNDLYIKTRDTTGLWRVARAAAQKNPKDDQACNNYAMLSLLLDLDAAKANATAAQLYAADSKNPVFASTYAFSLFKQGRTQEALAVFRNLGLDQLDNPSLATYYGIVLAASGDVATARRYLDKASQTFLLPQELAMVDHAKARR